MKLTPGVDRLVHDLDGFFQGTRVAEAGAADADDADMDAGLAERLLRDQAGAGLVIGSGGRGGDERAEADRPSAWASGDGRAKPAFAGLDGRGAEGGDAGPGVVGDGGPPVLGSGCPAAPCPQLVGGHVGHVRRFGVRAWWCSGAWIVSF